MANDAKFNFYINRQGPRGQRGEKGDQGFSPSITVNTNTADEYTLLIQNEYDSLVTDNIRPTYDDRGGTYVRVDRTNNVQYFGSADIATTANYGEVKLAQASDLASTVDVGNSNVITVELLKTWFGGQIADNLVTTTNNVTIQGQKIFATPTRFMDTVRVGNRLLVSQEDTGTITFDTDETGTVIGTHLTSTGDASFKQNVTVDGIATIEGGLNVAGNAVISNPQLGNTTISGDLTTNADINIQGQKVHLQHTNPTMYLKNMNGVNEIEIFRGLFTAGNPSPADNYLNLGHSQLQLNLTGKAIKANGKDVATADTVNAIQSDLNIAKQDIIEAQGDIDNLQMNKQNKLTAGTGITIDADNVISATGGVVDIPIASSTTLGGIKVGENLTISEDGTLSATGGGGGSSITYTAEAPLSISADNVISIDTTDLGGTTLKKDARMNVDYALDLIANGTVGGTSKAARAESNESMHDAYMAFSGHNPSDAISTLWGPNERKAGSWVELYLPDGVVPYSAAWTYGSTGEILPAVELLASNDGSSYTSLGSVTDVSTVTASMTFNTTDSYKYLRFKFRDACVSSAWGKFGLTSLKVTSGEVATYTELFIGDNIDVTNGVMNVNSLSGEVNTLSGDVTTLSGKVTAVEGKTTDLESAVENKQDKLTAGEGIQIEQVVSGELPLNWYKKDPDGGVSNPVPIATPIASEIDIQKYIYPCYGNNLDPTTTHSASIKYTMRVKRRIDNMAYRYHGRLAFNFGDDNKIEYEYYNNTFAMYPKMKNGGANINLSVSQNFLNVAEGDLITTEIAISSSKKTVDIKVYNKITGTVYATATASNIKWFGGPAGATSPYFYYNGDDAMGLLTDSIAISNMEDAQTQNIISSTIATTTTAGIVKPDGSTINIDANGVISSNGGGTSRNIGEIVASTIPLVDAGLHLLDGSRLSGDGIYKGFVDYIAELHTSNPNANYFCTETEWQTSVTTYGVCGKFVYNSTNDTVRLPKVTGIIEGTTDVTALGDLVEAGLPNITGTISSFTNGMNSDPTGSGALIVTKNSTGWQAGTGDRMGDYTASLNASSSNSIYGNSDTVQPQSTKVLYYIVIANSSKTDIQVDIDKIATDLNGKADTDLSNINASQSAKNEIISWGMPDYSAGKDVSSATIHTATVDGYVFAQAQSTSGGNGGHVDIYDKNGTLIKSWNYVGAELTQTYSYSAFMCPIPKGYSYNVHGGVNIVIQFYPAKGTEV